MSAIRPNRPRPSEGRGGGGRREPADASRPFLYEAALIAEARRLRGEAARLGEPPGERELADAARDLIALQRGLTGGRALIGSAYMDESRRLASYLLFYWSVSYAQARGMLAMASRGGSGAPAALRILDLGSGPAPCSIAAADSFASAAGASIVACDPSALALESARRLAETAGCRFTPVPDWRAGESPLPDGQFDAITVGHMLNELWAGETDRLERRLAFLETVLSRLAPGGILLVMEPALLSTGRELLALRDILAATGREILAPCLRAGPCPALAAEGQTCHSDFSWRAPGIVRELSARSGLGKDLVKTTAVVVRAASTTASSKIGGAAEAQVPKPEGAMAKTAASELSAPAGAYRVVSDPMVNKAGRVRYLICGEEGRFPFSAKRGEGFPAEQDFFSLKRSDMIRLSAPAARETGLSLGAETRIERASPTSAD